ncbi:MAG: hypothetical protein JXM70_16930 [Pirellulales bacterium]|nr:hypothetical protein [Pirellulales bacterium]
MTTNRLTIWMLFLAATTLTTAPLQSATAADDVKVPVLTVLERTTEPLLKGDHPWESMSIGPDAVLRIGDQWHLWYVAFDHDYRTDNDCYFCYARSKDGVHWEKPSLGIYSYKGNTDNNILLSGFNFCSFIYDEKAPLEERFKAVGASERETGGSPVRGGGRWWVFGATSPDGIHWKVIDEPLLKKNSDTGNICILDGNLYRLYVRMWSGGDFAGYRIVGYTESPTFGAFPDPVAILSPDKDDPRDMHFYNSAAAKLKDNLYLMFPSSYFQKTETVTVSAAFSRDGKNFQRLGRTPLLGLGKGFDKAGIYVCAGAIPAEKPNTYWIYYFGTAARHDATPEMHNFNGGLGRILLKVEDDAPELYGDSLAQAALWKDGSKLKELSGKTVRLRFVLEDADLYSIRFQGE